MARERDLTYEDKIKELLNILFILRECRLGIKMIWQAPTTKYGKDDEDKLFWVVLQDKNSGGDNML